MLHYFQVIMIDFKGHFEHGIFLKFYLAAIFATIHQNLHCQAIHPHHVWMEILNLLLSNQISWGVSKEIN